MKLSAYTQTIKQLKAAILASRYKAAALANKELLTLYFNVGKLITEREQQGKWGDKILEQLSNDLQHELPGLKGFSATNIKRMRLFYQQEDLLADQDGTFQMPLKVEKIYNGEREKYKDGWRNMIVFGDNLQFLKTCYANKDQLIHNKVKGKVKLIYIDPPFGTGDEYDGNSGQKAYQAKIKGHLLSPGISFSMFQSI